MKSTLLNDEFVKKLLIALQADPRASVAELSRQIGLSQTRTAERLRRLEETGVIEGYTVEINREALGVPLLAFIRLTCSGGKYRQFLEYIRTAGYVQECHHLTGGDAFLIKAALVSIEELERIIETLLPYGDPTTSIVLSSPVSRRRMRFPER